MAGALALGAAPAAAQMYPGQDVIVNPAAIGGPASNLPPVHLHPPRNMRHRTQPAPQPEQSSVESPAPARQTEQAVSTPPPPTAPAPVPARAAPPPPAKSASPSAIPFSFGGSEGGAVAPPNNQAAAPAPATRGTTAPVPATRQATAPAPAESKVASAAPPPKVTPEKGLDKQADVLFDQNATTLSTTSSARLNDMAFSLKTALAKGADHIELVAYGGNPGDKSSAARRTSLKRALAVREALIVDGVPANRIDVRALGGVTDNGPTDRVDIFVRS